MVCSPSAMMLTPNITAIAQAAYKNMSLARSGFTATSVPRICHTAASLGQASTHAPHFMQDISVSPLAIDSCVNDRVGQLFSQRTQGVQRVRSIFTSKTLVLLKIDWKAPNGQKNEHCVRFLVSRGRTMTNQIARPARKESIPGRRRLRRLVRMPAPKPTPLRLREPPPWSVI